MSNYGNNGKRVTPESLRVIAAERPDWVSGTERLPRVGDHVQCTEGLAEVVRILGRTGNGSRLLELAFADRPKQPFFAASSNVLVAPNDFRG